MKAGTLFGSIAFINSSINNSSITKSLKLCHIYTMKSSDVVMCCFEMLKFIALAINTKRRVTYLSRHQFVCWLTNYSKRALRRNKCDKCYFIVWHWFLMSFFYDRSLVTFGFAFDLILQSMKHIARFISARQSDSIHMIKLVITIDTVS